jgi:translation elongation factor P/translation initiation factor 5A
MASIADIKNGISSSSKDGLFEVVNPLHVKPAKVHL